MLMRTTLRRIPSTMKEYYSYYSDDDHPLITKGLLRKFLLSTTAWMAVILLFSTMNVLVLPSLTGFYLLEDDEGRRSRIHRQRRRDRLGIDRKKTSADGMYYSDLGPRQHHTRQRRSLGQGRDASPRISFVPVETVSATNNTETTITTHNDNNDKDHRIIYFLHIHKSGGSTMCQTARVNHMRTNDNHNCNVQTDQRCCGGQDSLQAQHNFWTAFRQRYNFVANEHDMYRAMDTAHYRYVVQLRDSRARYVSHWQHVFRLQRQQQQPTITFSEWYGLQPDNWNVRKICGTDCQTIPKYGISRRVFDETVQRLRKFDHVLFVEDFNRSYTAFANGVHWPLMPVFTPPARDVSYPVDDTPWDPLMSALDDALYALAKHRFEQGRSDALEQLSPELKDNLARYFADGSKRGCSNPCCGPTCSKY